MTNERDDDPALWFFREIVEPSANEAIVWINDVRRCCMAALALSAMADHFFHARTKEVASYTAVSKFREEMMARNWPFRQVVGVANATKHVVPKNYRVGFDAISNQQIGCGNMRCGWPLASEMVLVDVPDSGEWPLYQLIEASVEFWAEMLQVELTKTSGAAPLIT